MTGPINRFSLDIEPCHKHGYDKMSQIEATKMGEFFIHICCSKCGMIGSDYVNSAKETVVLIPLLEVRAMVMNNWNKLQTKLKEVDNGINN